MLFKTVLSNFLLNPSLKKKGIHIDLRASVLDSTFEGENFVQKDCKLNNCHVGMFTYICRNATLSNCLIGKFCSLAPEVKNIGGMHPTDKFVSTHPYFYKEKHFEVNTFVYKNKFGEYKWIDKEKRIQNIIGNDVWIGTGATLMEGITVGDGAVIAANAHIIKDVPPYAIVGGNPAKIIRYRFTDEKIKQLLATRWWNMDKNTLMDCADMFEDIDSFLEWMRLKEDFLGDL